MGGYVWPDGSKYPILQVKSQTSDRITADDEDYDGNTTGAAKDF